MAQQFACPHANNLLEKLVAACNKGQPLFSLPYEEFKNVSVKDIGAILSMTNIYAISRDTSKLRKLIVKKSKPTPELKSKPTPELKSTHMSELKSKHTLDLSGMPALIPCTLEEERYIIEQIALVEIAKLGKYPKITIDLGDD